MESSFLKDEAYFSGSCEIKSSKYSFNLPADAASLNLSTSPCKYPASLWYKNKLSPNVLCEGCKSQWVW